MNRGMRLNVASKGRRSAAAGLGFAAALLLASPALGQDGPASTAPARRPATTRPRRPAPPPAPPVTIPASTDMLRLQVALDRAGFSPGVIDGRPGPKTSAAVARWRESPSGIEARQSDPNALAPELGELPTLFLYTLTQEDIDAIGPIPRAWSARAELPRMTYERLSEMLAERGHCTRACLQRLNAGMDLDHLEAGDEVRLPNVASSTSIFTKLGRASVVEVHLGRKTVTPLDEAGRPAALFHCSIAKFVEKRPRGETTVKVVALEPNYTFDPKMWPEEKHEKRKLQIKPGPRNPVGLAWVGLDLPGYGIHGTPNPELIGKTGSHGCIRLTNWDAIRLARMVKVGTPVRFVE